MQVLTRVSHQRYVQNRVRERGGPFPTFLRTGPPPLGVVPLGYARDQGSRGSGCIGNWWGRKMCDPCADHKLRPICEDARHHHPQNTVRDHDAEALANAEEDFGARREATNSYPSSAAGKTDGRYR